MVAALLLTLLSGWANVQAGDSKDASKKVAIFAAEDFYKQEKAKEQEFVGQLLHMSNKIKDDGLGRPTRLGIVEFREETRRVQAGGKVVEEKVKVPVLNPVPVYVAGRAILLEPFNDK